MELSTFGAIFKFAIELEKEAAAYYERAAQEAGDPQVRDALAGLATTHRKRQQAAERMRREQVTEMILEPIYGLREEDWRLDLSAPGWQRAVELERRIGGFYAAAAEKVSIPEVSRRFRKLVQESAGLEDSAASLPASG